MVDKTSSACQARRQRMIRVGKGLRQIINLSELSGAYAAKRLHLHPTDLACIGLLAGTDPLSPKQIIANLGLSSGSGTALLDRLEAAGFVRRIPNPADRRSVLIELDRDKAAAPIAFYRHMQQSYSNVMTRFTDEELDCIAEFLEAVSAFEVIGKIDEIASAGDKADAH